MRSAAVSRPLLTAILAVGLIAGTARARQLVVTEVRLDSLGDLTALARAGFEVASVRTTAGVDYAAVVADPQQRADLGLAGFELRVGPAPVGAPPRFFRDFATIESALRARATARNDITLDTIGSSVEGRPILAVKIGAPDDAPARPNVLFVATHHAREWISTELAVRLIDWIADSLTATAMGQEVLYGRDVWVVPVLNPDGYDYSFTGERLWRKNRRSNADGSVGVDLNRNYPAFWGRDDIGSSPTTTAETFRGSAPASEPEVAAFIAFHDRHQPDIAVSYHSYTDLVLYPYAYAPGRLPPDAPLFRALAGTPLAPSIRDGLAESVRDAYHPGPGWQLYPTNGEYTEWAYRTHGTLAFTVELTSGCCVADRGYGFEFPDDSAAIAQVVADNIPFARAVIEWAGDLERARGPAGRPAEPTTVESLWPTLRVVGAPAIAALPAVERIGLAQQLLTLVADSLDRGAFRWRWQAPAAAVGPGTEIEVPAFGVRTTLLHQAGAEDTLTGWLGWPRDSSLAVEGRFAWLGRDDTLVSPVLDLSGTTEPHFAFWTRHGGSLFTPDRRGRVEFSADGGSTWLTVGIVEGAGGDWYPVHVALPQATANARVRLIAEDMAWLVDAVHVFGTLPPTQVAAEPGAVSFSENPVRSDRMFFSWMPVAGQATVSVLTFTGDLVFRATVAAQAGQLEWDVTTRGGARVGNGVYVAVVRLPDETLRRRLFVARTP